MIKEDILSGIFTYKPYIIVYKYFNLKNAFFLNICRVQLRLKNILENQSDAKNPVDFAQNHSGNPCNFWNQIYFQVCSNKNGLYHT